MSFNKYLPFLIIGAVIIILAAVFLYSKQKNIVPAPEVVQKIAPEVPSATWKEPFTGMEFVLVPGGCYEMGDTFGDGRANEKPVHKVCVDVFFMDRYEVTQKQWQTVMGRNPSKFRGCDDCPVERVSWYDAQDFIKKLNDQTGMRFRLPTEAEWEYAARSGGRKEKWAGTDNESSLGDYAWYDLNSNGRTHPVGQKRPNGLGLYDMNGNVWEWVNDWYDAKYYEKSPQKNPQGPLEGERPVSRGGCCLINQYFALCANRGSYFPAGRSGVSGFRCATTP